MKIHYKQQSFTRLIKALKGNTEALLKINFNLGNRNYMTFTIKSFSSELYALSI
jgi:hypothetical protein